MLKLINKEYLISSLRDFNEKVLSKLYAKIPKNQSVLDKLDEADGNLLFDGKQIEGSSVPGQDGVDGKSAYQIALDNGFEGTESEWLESLKGKDGTNGVDGVNGVNGQDGENGTDGTNGKSAYEIAVQNGFTGTEQEWLESLKGEQGEPGKSADQIDAYTKNESDAKFVTSPQIWTGSNQFKFGIDADGNYGYIKAGADTVTPFKSGTSTQVPYGFYCQTVVLSKTLSGDGFFIIGLDSDKWFEMYPYTPTKGAGLLVVAGGSVKSTSYTNVSPTFYMDGMYRPELGKPCTSYSTQIGKYTSVRGSSTSTAYQYLFEYGYGWQSTDRKIIPLSLDGINKITCRWSTYSPVTNGVISITIVANVPFKIISKSSTDIFALEHPLIEFIP